MLGSLQKAGRLSDVVFTHGTDLRWRQQLFDAPGLTAVVFMMRKEPWASCLAMTLPASQDEKFRDKYNPLGLSEDGHLTALLRSACSPAESRLNGSDLVVTGARSNPAFACHVLKCIPDMTSTGVTQGQHHPESVNAASVASQQVNLRQNPSAASCLRRGYLHAACQRAQVFLQCCISTHAPLQ